MARKPEVFVRAVTPEEGRRLQKITRTSKQPVRMRRTIVVMASAQRQPVLAIARLMQISEAYARQVIHEFNERGSKHWTRYGAGAGRRRWIGRRVNASPAAAPATWVVLFSTWSLSKLREVLRVNTIAEISREPCARS